MYSDKCETQNPDDLSVRNGSNIAIETKTSNNVNKKSNFEQLHIISEEIEKLDTIYKLGFYIQGFLILVVGSIYSLLILPIAIYLLGGRGWPKNSMVKTVLYHYTYVIPIFFVIGIVVILAAVIAAFVFGI